MSGAGGGCWLTTIGASPPRLVELALDGPHVGPRAGRTHDRSPVGAAVDLGMRATVRFTQSRATLLAAGTTYYLFLALFSILTLAYGLTAALGAEQLSAYITEALSEAFPGLVGGSGIDPDQLRSAAQVTSIVSAVALLSAARTSTSPGAVVVASTPGGVDAVPLLEGRGLVDGRAAAYVCRGMLCRRPVTTVEDLLAELALAD